MKITIMPADLSAQVEAGDSLLDAGHKAEVEMEAGCFDCSCGTCTVEVLDGMDHLEPPSSDELEVLDAWSRDSDRYRLACCARIRSGDVVVRQLD